MVKKPSMGRQKIKMAKIQIKNHLQVTFSKRRSGLFKKASELCTLCDIEIAIVVFSPAGKVFSFGHPNVDLVIGRFLAKNPTPNPISFNILEAHRNASVCELNLHLGQILNELDIAIKRGETLNHVKKTNQTNHHWCEGPVEKLGLHELEQLRDAMEELIKRNVTTQASTIMSAVASPPKFFASTETGIFYQYESKPNLDQVFVGSSSGLVDDNNFGFCHGFF